MRRKDINDLYYAIGYAHGAFTMLWDIEDWIRQIFDDTSFADRLAVVLKNLKEIENDMYDEVKRLEKESANEEA